MRGGGPSSAGGKRQMFDCTPQILIMCRDSIRRRTLYARCRGVGDGKISGKARLRDDTEHRPPQIICWFATHYKMFCRERSWTVPMLGKHRTIPALRQSTAPAAAARHLRCQMLGYRVAVPASCFGAKSPSHSATAAPASVRCFRHWRRSPLQHPVSALWASARLARRNRHLELCGIALKNFVLSPAK